MDSMIGCDRFALKLNTEEFKGRKAGGKSYRCGAEILRAVSVINATSKAVIGNEFPGTDAEGILGERTILDTSNEHVGVINFGIISERRKGICSRNAITPESSDGVENW